MKLSLLVYTNQDLPSVSCEEMLGTQTFPARNGERTLIDQKLSARNFY